MITGRAAEVRVDHRCRRAQVVVDVERVGVCGTDVEFFTGEMAYLHQGHAAYPMRHRPRVVRHRRRGRRRRRPGLARPAGHRRHDARLRPVPALPRPAGSTSARTGTRSASGAACPARWPSSSPCRSARCIRCPTASTRRPGRWSSPAATRCAPCAAAQPDARRSGAGPRPRHHRPAGRRARAGRGRRGAPAGR